MVTTMCWGFFFSAEVRGLVTPPTSCCPEGEVPEEVRHASQNADSANHHVNTKEGTLESAFRDARHTSSGEVQSWGRHGDMPSLHGSVFLTQTLDQLMVIAKYTQCHDLPPLGFKNQSLSPINCFFHKSRGGSSTLFSCEMGLFSTLKFSWGKVNVGPPLVLDPRPG
jgi:hypothetical protein